MNNPPFQHAKLIERRTSYLGCIHQALALLCFLCTGVFFNCFKMSKAYDKNELCFFKINFALRRGSGGLRVGGPLRIRSAKILRWLG